MALSDGGATFLQGLVVAGILSEAPARSNTLSCTHSFVGNLPIGLSHAIGAVVRKLNFGDTDGPARAMRTVSATTTTQETKTTMTTMTATIAW